MEKATVTKIDDSSVVVKCRCNDEHTVKVDDNGDLHIETKEGTPDAKTPNSKKEFFTRRPKND